MSDEAVDLAALAAEFLGEGRVVTVDGKKKWTILAEQPWGMFIPWAKRDIFSALAMLPLDAKQGPAFAEAVLSLRLGEDGTLKLIRRLYQVDPGESPASSPSSSTDGKRSRPTSKRTTASTSAK